MVAGKAARWAAEFILEEMEKDGRRDTLL